MKVACLQFDPKLGEIARNIEKAESLLADASLENVDLLVLPEMALTGINS